MSILDDWVLYSILGAIGVIWLVAAVYILSQFVRPIDLKRKDRPIKWRSF